MGESDRRPILINLPGTDRQDTGYFHRWLSKDRTWTALVEFIRDGHYSIADIRDIVFMDNEPYTLGIWERMRRDFEDDEV